MCVRLIDDLDDHCLACSALSTYDLNDLWLVSYQVLKVLNSTELSL